MTRKPNEARAAASPSRKGRGRPGSRTKRKAAKGRSRDEADWLVVACAHALGLPVDPAWRGAVKFNLQLILRHALLVAQFDLPDEAEPAPVFHA